MPIIEPSTLPVSSACITSVYCANSTSSTFAPYFSNSSCSSIGYSKYGEVSGYTASFSGADWELPSDDDEHPDNSAVAVTAHAVSNAVSFVLCFIIISFLFSRRQWSRECICLLIFINSGVSLRSRSLL